MPVCVVVIVARVRSEVRGRGSLHRQDQQVARQDQQRKPSIARVQACRNDVQQRRREHETGPERERTLKEAGVRPALRRHNHASQQVGAGGEAAVEETGVECSHAWELSERAEQRVAGG